MQKNGAEQPKVYRHIRTMLKIRSTPTEGKQIAEESQTAEPLCTDCTTLENAPDAQNAQHTPYTPGTCKSTCQNFGKPAKSFSDFYL